MPLIAHYPLQEDSGGTAYDVAGNNNGTNNGATVGANGILGGSAYEFDGTDDIITTPTSSVYNFSAADQMSLSAWFKPDSVSGNSIIVSGRQDGNDALVEKGIEIKDGNIRLKVYQNSVTGPSASIGEWYHSVLSYNGGDYTLYVNGVDEGSNSHNADRTDKYVMGTDGKGSSYLDGRIADVRIYDHALTASEVQYLYSVSQRGSYVSGRQTL